MIDNHHVSIIKITFSTVLLQMRILFIISIFLFLSELHAQSSVKKWRFYDAQKRIERVYAQGDYLVIIWKGSKRTIKTHCVLEDIKSDSVCISIKNHEMQIAKQDILKIRDRKKSVFGRLMVFFTIALGVFIIGFAFLVQAIYNSSRQDYQLASGETALYWPWSFLGVVVLIGGILLHKSKPIGIQQPFDSERTSIEVIEKTPKPGNQFP